MDKEIKKFISSSVDYHDFAHSVEIASELGLGIEISRFGKLKDIEENYEKIKKEYKAILSGFEGEVSLHGFFSNLCVASKDPLIQQVSIKRYNQSFELACVFGAKRVIFHTCFNNLLKHREYQSNYFVRNVEFFNEFIKNFEREGIIAHIENVHEPNPDFIRNLVGVVNSPNLKVCLDIGHVNLHSEMKPQDWVKEYGIMLNHLHLHNNFKDEDAHSSLLKGTIELMPILSTIKELNINPSYTFEIFDEVDLRESVKHFDEVMEKV